MQSDTYAAKTAPLFDAKLIGIVSYMVAHQPTDINLMFQLGCLWVLIHSTAKCL